MNTIEIPDIDFRAEIPSHWDEMTPLQVDYCLKHAILASFGLIEPIQAKVRCLYHLLDIKRDWKTEVWEKTQPKSTVLDKNSRIIILAEQLCSFIFKETVIASDAGAKQSPHPTSDIRHPALEVHYNTLTNHFPQLTAGKYLLNGPGDMLTGMSFGEFRTAMVHMQAYFQSKTQRDLSRMIGCLYRIAPDHLDELMQTNDWNGQTRVPFNPDQIERYADYADQLSAVHRTAILLWFTFVIDTVKKTDLTINGIEVNFSVLFSGGEGGGGQGTGWTGVLYGVAEKKIFGDADDVDRRDWLEVLFYLYDKEMENRRIKAKLKTKRS
jgi:hypothetical protein